jgi:putative intracellular protease/amidase
LQKKKVLIVLPEEPTYIEVVRIFLLVNGAEATFATRSGTLPTGNVFSKIKSVATLSEINPTLFDGIIIMDTGNNKFPYDDTAISKIIKGTLGTDIVVAAVGKASVAVVQADSSLLAKKVTCDPDCSSLLIDVKANYTGKEVEKDENIITTTAYSTKIVKSFLATFKNALLKAGSGEHPSDVQSAPSSEGCPGQ